MRLDRDPPTTQAVCFDFTKGKCNRGDGCRFLHSSAAVKDKQASSVVTCAHCSKKGHVADNCFSKYPEKRPARNTTRAKQGVAAARTTRPNAARAANFLLNIRQNVDNMLLEAEEDVGHAEVFKKKHAPSEPLLMRQCFPPSLHEAKFVYQILILTLA